MAVWQKEKYRIEKKSDDNSFVHHSFLLMFFACQQAMKYMEEKGGILNFSTSVVRQMSPAYSVYAGTKGAVEQFTRQLAKELAVKQITINAASQGPENTNCFIQAEPSSS